MRVLKLLMFFLILIFPLGQLTKIPLRIAEVNVYLQDLIIFALVISWLIWHFKRKKAFNRPPLFWPITLFSFTASISLMVNLSKLNSWEALVSFLYLLRWVFYSGVYVVLYDILIYDINAVRRVRLLLVLAGIETAVLGLTQYFLYPNLRNLYYLGWDPHFYRAFGTFLDPGFLGIILVLTLILLVNTNFYLPHLPGVHSATWKVLRSDSFQVRLIKKIFYALALVITYLALALTYSRSSYLAYLVGIGAIAWLKKAPKFFLTVVLAGILTILVLPRPSGSEGVRLEREESTLARVKSWQQSLTIFRGHPLFGVGFNAYRYVQKEYGFLKAEDWQTSHSGAGGDSSLLFVLATTGIVGFISYLWLWFKIIAGSYRRSRQRGNLVVLASALALLIDSLFLNSLFYSWVMLWFWILLAIPLNLKAGK